MARSVGILFKRLGAMKEKTSVYSLKAIYIGLMPTLILYGTP